MIVYNESCDVPVPFICIEIRPNLVQHRGFNLEYPCPRRLRLWPDNMYYQPLLVLALRNRRMPVLDLLLHCRPIRLRILAHPISA